MVHTRSIQQSISVTPALPSEAEIRAELDRIQSSPEFNVPERARKFLVYVVEEAVADRADRIKAYSIAMEVFGRDASFDAQTDPVVRIEAGRLRRALERYYFTAGENDPLVVTIPKGAYVPVFTRRDRSTSLPPIDSVQKEPVIPSRSGMRQWILWGLVAVTGILLVLSFGGLLRFNRTEEGSVVSAYQAGRATPNVPRLLVTPFEDLSDNERSAIVARGLTDKVIEHIAKFKEIVVVTQRQPAATGEFHSESTPAARYVLAGGVRIDGDKLRLTARLVNQSDGSIAWADSYSENLRVSELMDLETNVARAVATAVAQPYGIIFRTDASHAANLPPDDWQAYECTLAYYGYRADLTPRTHASVQGCLKRAVERFPGYATAWALLSLTYLDEFRFRYRLNPPSPPPLELAFGAARRAVELDPQNVRGLQAEMLTFFFRGDVDTALAIGARAFSINPNDPELSAEYGFRLALSGEWESGCDLVADAVSRNPGPLGYFETSLALCAYMQQDYAAADQLIRAADVQANPIFHFVVAAISGQLGKTAEAARERRWIEANAADLLSNVRREVAMRIYRPEDQAHFISGLVKAGLPVPEFQ
ncbi:integral membrane protein [Sinorhizobium fredii]|uniref:Adenylate cyclase n=1 Tax=Rhizobium fredii TaxID=380 RepID=A0A844AIG1_RHIFR|nr:integral membrane protein [Sinorhizobium fredii]ASY71574.1 Adenylate cyclase [Sinorhizobium fredii CCBAU 83666]MQX11912.1 hypothetical protein [Sinorhizobium fredii]GEC35523.1 hypothetical protein EFR01_56940 [Sinorhizobium fredii]GLS06731.1 hypothetical protein GCM10007864_03560 [Sinorhizobium fredii]